MQQIMDGYHYYIYSYYFILDIRYKLKKKTTFTDVTGSHNIKVLTITPAAPQYGERLLKPKPLQRHLAECRHELL